MAITNQKEINQYIEKYLETKVGFSKLLEYVKKLKLYIDIQDQELKKDITKVIPVEIEKLVEVTSEDLELAVANLTNLVKESTTDTSGLENQFTLLKQQLDEAVRELKAETEQLFRTITSSPKPKDVKLPDYTQVFRAVGERIAAIEASTNEFSKQIELLKSDLPTVTKLLENYKDEIDKLIRKELNELAKKKPNHPVYRYAGAMASNRTSVPNLTATGTTQATALPLTGDFSLQEITTVNGNTGVRLPRFTESSSVTIVNRGVNTLRIYPAFGCSINNGTVNAAIQLTPNSSVEILGKSSTVGYTLPFFGGSMDIAQALAFKASNAFTTVVTATGSAVALNTADAFYLYSADGVILPYWVGSNQIYFYFSPSTAATMLAPYIDAGIKRGEVLAMQIGDDLCEDEDFAFRESQFM